MSNTNERAELIARLRMAQAMMEYNPIEAHDAMGSAADMLEADAREISATERQVAVPQAMEDLAGVTVCCGDFAKCHRPCTPRGQWMATEAQQVSVPAEILSAISRAGLTLLKTQHGYELRKLGPAIAHTSPQGDKT